MAETNIFKVKKGESTTKAYDRALKKRKALDKMIMGEGKGLTMPEVSAKAKKKEEAKVKPPKSRIKLAETEGDRLDKIELQMENY